MMRIVMQDVGPRRSKEDTEEDPEVLEDDEEQVCAVWQCCQARQSLQYQSCKLERV